MYNIPNLKFGMLQLPLEPESSAAQEDVPLVPAPTREEINDDDQGTSDQVTTELRRSTRTCSAPEWYGNPVLEIMLLDNGEPSNYEEAMAGLDSKMARGHIIRERIHV